LSRGWEEDISFEISIDEHAADYSVISVRGEVDLHSSPRLERAIERGSEGVKAVVVDMSDISFMDSTVLSAFMQAREELGERGISLRLVSPSSSVKRLFEITGLGDYFEVYPSREAATDGG
jgi:anti-sigma B factor antagonist